MSWVSTELREAVHVHPFYESGHVLGPWCWCDPRVDDEDDRPMLVHHDKLEREMPDV